MGTRAYIAWGRHEPALERLGFDREGHLADEEFVDGEPADVYRFGLLACEWLD